MNLGEIIKMAAEKDMAGTGAGRIIYEESESDNKFHIKLKSHTDKDAYIECSIPYTGEDEEKNYLRLYFLSMAFNAGIYGMKKLRTKTKDKW